MKPEQKIVNLKIETMRIKLVGDSPLIMHKWSEKAKTEMRDKQQKKPKAKKDVRNPAQEFEDSMYILQDEPRKYGFPVIAFKAAAVDGITQIEGMTKIMARGCFHIQGEFAEINSEPPVMREDMVRVGMGAADLRYRGEFRNWWTELEIRYNSTAVTAEQIINLFQVAGFACGVGEWRPQKDGQFGMFHVEQ